MAIAEAMVLAAESAASSPVCTDFLATSLPSLIREKNFYLVFSGSSSLNLSLEPHKLKSYSPAEPLVSDMQLQTPVE